jgi:hypothetical protein
MTEVGRPVHKHSRDAFFVEGEGVFEGESRRAPKAGEAPEFRFSRLGPEGVVLGPPIRRKIARAMTEDAKVLDGSIPAGYTYLGQFVDHDLTFDKTSVMLGEEITPADLLQGRSPTLDLDSLYGAGPTDPVSAEFYADDRHLKMGKTARVGSDLAREGFDLPRSGRGATRRILIPDVRNDENLAVGQTHLAMIRFHNRVADTLGRVPENERFLRARRRTTMHYQWMLRTDYLTRICGSKVVNDVYKGGRKVIDVGVDPLSMPTMPIEFSIAAFRLGHSMVRAAYDWNARFPDGNGTLDLLFFFSGTGGTINPLPSNWIADWRRLYRFTEIKRGDLKPPPGELNMAHRIDTVVTPALRDLPPSTFGGTDASADAQAGQRPADGGLPAEQGRRGRHPDQDPAQWHGDVARRPDRGRA